MKDGNNFYISLVRYEPCVSEKTIRLYISCDELKTYVVQANQNSILTGERLSKDLKQEINIRESEKYFETFGALF